MSSTTQQQTNEQPHSEEVGLHLVMDWLKRGWDDLQATGYRGVLYGLIFTVMGYMIVWVYATQWQLTMALIAGFFLLGPFICMGIYELSRQRQDGETVDLLKSLTCWRRAPRAMALYAAILTIAVLFWARVSIILFALFSVQAMPSLVKVLNSILSMENITFILIWFAVGFVFAAFTFAFCSLSAPYILDQKHDPLGAMFASFKAVSANAGLMFVWAMVIAVLIGGSLVAGFLPLIITAPVVGHATFHAYSDLIKKQAVVDQ